MTKNKDHLTKKRKKALEKLQSNRGKNRSKTESSSTAKAEGINLLVREFRRENDNPKNPENTKISSSESEIDKNELKSENLPKLAKAEGRIKEKQEETAQAVKRLKENRKRIQEIRLAKQKEPESSSSESQTILEQNNRQFRHQLKQDLLTADFWQQVSQWLSGINTDIHLSSTPPEEIELLYKQVKHRYQALKLMLEQTESELDAFEAYFRNLESLSHLENKDL